MKRFSIKRVLFLVALAAIIFGGIVSKFRPFQPSLSFENVRVTSVDQSDGTTKIAISGSLRNTGREWLQFLAEHTQVSGYYTTSAEPNTAQGFEYYGIGDFFGAGLGPAETMPLAKTISIPHSRLQDVSVTISVHIAAGHSKPGSTRYGWAKSRTYNVDEPSDPRETSTSSVLK